MLRIKTIFLWWKPMLLLVRRSFLAFFPVHGREEEGYNSYYIIPIVTFVITSNTDAPVDNESNISCFERVRVPPRMIPPLTKEAAVNSMISTRLPCSRESSLVGFPPRNDLNNNSIAPEKMYPANVYNQNKKRNSIAHRHSKKTKELKNIHKLLFLKHAHEKVLFSH